MIITFGEAMVRYLVNDSMETIHVSPGGSELNVAVALSKLGWNTEWVSVLPAKSESDVVITPTKEAGVGLTHLVYTTTGNVGSYRINPVIELLEYDRSESAFAKQPTGLFDWIEVLRNARWVHLTGITPMLGDTPRVVWEEVIQTVDTLNINLSIDLNHRPALGSLERLWEVVRPFLSKIKLLVLSQDIVHPLLRLENLEPTTLDISTNTAEEKSPFSILANHLLSSMNKDSMLALCRKEPLEVGGQHRWSQVAIDSYPIIQTPRIHHHPVEQLGGGDAWVAGFIDGWLSSMDNYSQRNQLPDRIAFAAMRGDRLAALSQDSLGDFSQVDAATLDRWTDNGFGVTK